jgi:hypothetical protein
MGSRSPFKLTPGWRRVYPCFEEVGLKKGARERVVCENGPCESPRTRETPSMPSPLPSFGPCPVENAGTPACGPRPRKSQPRTVRALPFRVRTFRSYLFKALISGGLGLAAFAGMTPLASTQSPETGRQYHVERLDVQLTLRPDGGADVKEVLALRFEGGPYREGFREIPMRGIVGIDDVRVSSPDVEVADLRVRTRNRTTEVTWGFEPMEGRVQFEILYRLDGVLRTDGGQNLLDWDAVGDGWTVPLEAVTVSVRIPAFDLRAEELDFLPGMPEGQVTSFETGGQDGTDGLQIRFIPGALPSQTPYRVKLWFPLRVDAPPVAAPPGPFEPVGLFVVIALIVGVLVPSAGAFAMRTRRPPVQRSGLRASPHPPAWLARMEGASYWADLAIPPTLIQLARRGVLVLQPATPEGERENPGERRKAGDREEEGRADEQNLKDQIGGAAGEVGAHDFIVTILNPGERLTTFERELVAAFQTTPSYQTFRQDEAKRLKKLRRLVEVEMTNAGLFQPRADRTRVLHRLGLMLVLLGPLGAILPAVRALPGAVPWMVGVFGVVCGLGVILLGMRDWSLTPEGEMDRARHLAFMREIRRGILSDLARMPERAEGLLQTHFEALLVSAPHAPFWFSKMQGEFKKAGVELRLPEGIFRPFRREAEGGAPDSIQVAQMHQLLWMASSPGGMAAQASASGSATGSSPGVGVGASGGFGGGGGGFR